MNGNLVGSLVRQSSGLLGFTYNGEWLQDKNACPISLSMPLAETAYYGDNVLDFFDNLLPDNESIRKRIQKRFAIQSNQSFDILASIGADCVGALQLLSEKKSVKNQHIQAVPIDDHAIAELLKNYQSAPLGMEKNTDFRISIAGAQEKTALLWHKDKWHLPHKDTPTTHIIKLPIGRIQHSNIDLSESVENEWLCLQILSAFGLPVNDAKITNFEDVKVLVVKRFDRVIDPNKSWIHRLPQEDFCQVLGKPSNLKYESDGGPGIFLIMQQLLGSNNLADRERFMKAVFLFWILGAIDGHAKNFSVFIEPGGRYKLTPLYDVMSAYPIAAKRQLEWQDLKMAMSLKSKNRHYLWDRIQPRHWIAMAEHCHFSPKSMQKIIDEVFDNMESVIAKVAEIVPDNFPKHIMEPIFDGMLRIKKRSISDKISNVGV
jgi:serine/threonine-protein kinase HipA